MPEPTYLATVRRLLELWAPVGCPELLLPRHGGRAEPYLVGDLGQWFLESREPVGNGWAPRQAWELAGVFASLEGAKAACQGMLEIRYPSEVQGYWTVKLGNWVLISGEHSFTITRDTVEP